MYKSFIVCDPIKNHNETMISLMEKALTVFNIVATDFHQFCKSNMFK